MLSIALVPLFGQYLQTKGDIFSTYPESGGNIPPQLFPVDYKTPWTIYFERFLDSNPKSLRNQIQKKMHFSFLSSFLQSPSEHTCNLPKHKVPQPPMKEERSIPPAERKMFGYCCFSVSVSLTMSPELMYLLSSPTDCFTMQQQEFVNCVLVDKITS